MRLLCSEECLTGSQPCAGGAAAAAQQRCCPALHHRATQPQHNTIRQQLINLRRLLPSPEQRLTWPDSRLALYATQNPTTQHRCTFYSMPQYATPSNAPAGRDLLLLALLLGLLTGTTTTHQPASQQPAPSYTPSEAGRGLGRSHPPSNLAVIRCLWCVHTVATPACRPGALLTTATGSGNTLPAPVTSTHACCDCKTATQGLDCKASW